MLRPGIPLHCGRQSAKIQLKRIVFIQEVLQREIHGSRDYECAENSSLWTEHLPLPVSEKVQRFDQTGSNYCRLKTFLPPQTD